jgi:hypothetical protein
MMSKTKKHASDTKIAATTQDVTIPLTSRSKVTRISLRKKVELPERLQSLLVDNSDHVELKKKMDLLKSRHKHAVKSELISFCYASSDPSSDTGLDPPSSIRNREMVKTLMDIVEKDKDMADLAVGLVEDMESLEKAKTGYVSKRSGAQTEESTFHQIWENHKSLRKHIASILDDERRAIYGEKDVGDSVRIIRKDPDDSQDEDDEAEEDILDSNFERAVILEKETMASDIPPETEEDMREQEIRRGIQKIMKRLGCDDAYSSGSCQDNLDTIQKHFQSLRQDIKKLKE